MPKYIKYEPYAENGLAADFLWHQRKYYNEALEIYPSSEGLPKSINIWYNKPLFGKVDLLQRYVFPKPANLKSLEGKADLKTINFVADAYADFVSFVEDGAKKFQTCMTSIINYKNPVKAFYNLPGNFYDYFVELDEAFINNYLTSKKENEIAGFDRYMKEYTLYAMANSSFPQTLVGYLASNRVSNRVGGLTIEFGTPLTYDNDKNKWKKFLSSDFFIDYIKIASHHGFYVDKNIPWSIVANLNSANMKKYMNKYDVQDAAQNFSKNYFLAEYLSYISFKKYMFGSYQTFVWEKPRIEKYNFCNCISASGIASSIYRSKRVLEKRSNEFNTAADTTYENFLKLYSEEYLLRKYIHIRMIESRISLPKQKLQNIIMSVIYKYRKYGLYQATLLLSELMITYSNAKYDLLISKKSDDKISKGVTLMTKDKYNTKFSNTTTEMKPIEY